MQITILLIFKIVRKIKYINHITQEKNKKLMISLPKLPAHQIQMQNLFPLVKQIQIQKKRMIKNNLKCQYQVIINAL